MVVSVQAEEVLLLGVSWMVVEVNANCLPAEYEKMDAKVVCGRYKQVTAAHDMTAIANTCLYGSDCPSTRHPLSVGCTYPTGSFHCVPACGLLVRSLARTLQFVTFSRRVEPLVCTPLPVWRSGYCAEESKLLAMAVMCRVLTLGAVVGARVAGRS